MYIFFNFQIELSQFEKNEMDENSSNSNRGCSIFNQDPQTSNCFFGEKIYIQFLKGEVCQIFFSNLIILTFFFTKSSTLKKSLCIPTLNWFYNFLFYLNGISEKTHIHSHTFGNLTLILISVTIINKYFCRRQIKTSHKF